MKRITSVAMIGACVLLPLSADGQVFQPREAGRQLTLEAKPEAAYNRLVVKFRDEAKVRMVPNAGEFGLQSESDANLASVAEVAAAHDLSFKPVFADVPAASLQALQARAAANSGVSQPDLAGIHYVEGGDPVELRQAGLALLKTGQVQWVEWDWKIKMHGAGGMGVAEQLGASLPAAMGGTGDFSAQQGYYDVDQLGHDLAMMHDTGQFIIDHELTAPNWDGGNGARGAGTRIGVIDWCAWVEHEDLNDVILEPGIVMPPAGIDNTNQPDEIFDGYNHGTACLGIVAGRDNGFGVNGAVPDVEAWFFPSVDITGGRLNEAFISAYTFLEPGDVVSVSLGLGDRPLYFSALYSTLMLMGWDTGITTVISAGNESNDLNEFELPEPVLTRELIPCICVGAGYIDALADTPACGGTTPFPPYNKLGFSNFFTEQELEIDDVNRRIHVQSWGTDVTTLGYGDLFVPADDGDDNFDEEFVRSYTAGFGGTSAAAPIIAGLAASLQGMARMYYGTHLLPGSVRDLIAGNALAQEQAPTDELVSSEASPECGGDGNFCTVNDYAQFLCPDFTDVIDISHLIGGFTDTNAMISAFLSTNFFDVDPELVDFEVLRGTHIQGILITLGNLDGLGIEIASEMTSPDDEPTVPNWPQLDYFVNGQTTDLGLVALPSLPQSPVFTMNITYGTGIFNGATFGGLLGTQLYNWETERWDIVQIFFAPSGGVIGSTINVTNPRRYVREDDGIVLLRQWIQVPDLGTFGNGFEAIYDFFDIDFTAGGLSNGDGI